MRTFVAAVALALSACSCAAMQPKPCRVVAWQLAFNRTTGAVCIAVDFDQCGPQIVCDDPPTDRQRGYY